MHDGDEGDEGDEGYHIQDSTEGYETDNEHEGDAVVKATTWMCGSEGAPRAVNPKGGADCEDGEECDAASAPRAFGSARLHVVPCSWDVTWCTYPGNLLGPLVIRGDFSGRPTHP